MSVFDACLEKIFRRHPRLYLSRQARTDLKTAFVEAAANAIKHAHELKKNRRVEGRFVLDRQAIGFDVCDHGKGFDLDQIQVPDLSHLQAGGRGIFMMRQLGDELAYKKQKKKNVLSFRRNFMGGPESSQELDLLYELSEAIIGQASIVEVYQIILERALKLFHVERASILTYDEEAKALKVVASRGLKKNIARNICVRAGEGVSGYVFQHGRPLLIEDIDKNKRGLEKKKHYKTGSFISAPMICSPLRLGEKPIGVINLTDRVDGKKFTKKDLKLLSTIANQAMACFYIKGLVEEIKKNDALKKEVEQIGLIQSSYLPKTPPRLAGWDLAGRCEMAQSAGGDYFDYIFVKKKLYLIVADVSGHEIGSAITMVNFRSQMKALLSQGMGPAEVLCRLNQSLHDDLRNSGQFVSALLINLDTGTGHYEMANAGHYPPLVFSGRVTPSRPGVVLGVKSDEIYELTSGEIEAGDGMVLFTDGVVESMDRNGEMFGIVRLKQFVSKNDRTGAGAVTDRLIQNVLAFRQAARILDDITVMVVKRKS